MKKTIWNRLESRKRKVKSIKKRKNPNEKKSLEERKEEKKASQVNQDLLNVQEKNVVENSPVQAQAQVVLLPHHLQVPVSQDPRLNQRTLLCMIIT